MDPVAHRPLAPMPRSVSRIMAHRRVMLLHRGCRGLERRQIHRVAVHQLFGHGYDVRYSEGWAVSKM